MVLVYCLGRLPSGIRENKCSQSKWVMAYEGREVPGVRYDSVDLSAPGLGRQKQVVESLWVLAQSPLLKWVPVSQGYIVRSCLKTQPTHPSWGWVGHGGIVAWWWKVLYSVSPRKLPWLESQTTWVLFLALPLTNSVTVYCLSPVFHICQTVWPWRPLSALLFEWTLWCLCGTVKSFLTESDSCVNRSHGFKHQWYSRAMKRTRVAPYVLT